MALLVVVATAGVIAASSWEQSQSPGRLAIGGVVCFVIALILGSGRLVALTSLLILPAGLMTFVGDDARAWVRGVAIGVLWYVAAELAWDAIERRDGVRRTAAYGNRRIDEASKVVLLSLVIAAAAVMLSGMAPPRTVFVFAIVLGGLAAALAAATREIRRRGAHGDARGVAEPPTR
jgi:hypothetical protein